MDDLRKEIELEFGRGEAPPAANLVDNSGSDALDKERAVAFYSGKSWGEVRDYLRRVSGGEVFDGYGLEEWSVLATGALAYYLRGHLEFLLEALAADPPDEEYVFAFLGELYQVIYMHKGSPFTAGQTLLLKKIAALLRQSADAGRFPDYGEDIRESAGRFLAALQF